MFVYNTVLNLSPVHGLGVFSDENIPQGEAVYCHQPVLDLMLTAKQFNKLDLRDQAFILHHGGFDKRVKRYRLGYDNIRFLNHSDHPNLGYDASADRIFALRDILAGEELTQNYRDFEDDVESRFQKTGENH